MARDFLGLTCRLQGVKESVAKYRFVQLVRSLKFYGITFFDNCKMRVPGKKELQPFVWGMSCSTLDSWQQTCSTLVFLHTGISKEKIFKYEADTEKELGSWKYEQLRKWVFLLSLLSTCSPADHGPGRVYFGFR